MLRFESFLVEKAGDWHEQHPVSHLNVLDHYNQATATEKALGMSWYRRAHVATAQIAHETGLSNTQMAGLVSTYSPQTEWHKNLLVASHVARTKQAVGGKGQAPIAGGMGVMAQGSQKKAAEAILGGKHYYDVLAGRKTRNFAHLVEFGGDKNPKIPHVAIDRHAWSVAAGSRIPDSAFHPPTKKQYNNMMGAYVQAADHLNKQAQNSNPPQAFHINPHQVQAITWLVRQRKNNEEDQAAAVATMRSKGGGSWLPGLEPTVKDLPNKQVKVGKTRVSSVERWKTYSKEHHPKISGMFEEKKMKRFQDYLIEKAGVLRPLKPGQAAYGVGGRSYESSIIKSLQKNKLMNPHSVAAGSSANAPDAHILTRSGAHHLEVKQSKGAMFGQFELHHNGKHWIMSPNSEAKYPQTAAAIKKSGFLRAVNKQWKNPPTNYKRDLKQGNVWKTIKGTDAIAAHYHEDRKTPYIHIGKSGLFHFTKDPAGLGTTKLSGDTQLRARFKYRKTNMATGKAEYGALITMNLKNANKSNLDLENKEHIKTLALKHSIPNL